VILLRNLIAGMTLLCTILLVLASGCTGDILTNAGVGNFGDTPAPATGTSVKSGSNTASGSAAAGYSDCMNTCKTYAGMNDAQCTQACCISECPEDSPGGSEACYNRCLGTTMSTSTQSSGAPMPGTTRVSGTTSGFTCEYDEPLLKTSPEFSGWFNTSCYYNDYCKWWESNDLRPPAADDQNCINCSIDSLVQPAPTHTPCPARTTKPAPMVTTTTAALSSGTCGAGLTQCRVFSTNYCVDLMTDVSHCGSCRNGCLLNHAENGCADGKCYIKSCDKGWADCNGIPDDGCEVDLNADDNNCGRCGHVCSLPNAGYSVCNGVDEDGKCEVEHCATGWLNQNGYHEDGCEVFYTE